MQSLGQLDSEGLKRGTKAAIELSSALGIDLNAAILLVGKAAAGEVSSFSRYGLIVKKASTDSETFENVLGLIEKRFGGTAQAQVKTFSGAIEQLSNTYGDQLEILGDTIVKNETFIALINRLNAFLLELGKRLLKNQDAIVNFINNGIDIAISAFKSLTSIVSFVIDNFGKLTRALIVFGATFAGLKIAILISNFGLVNAGLITMIGLFSKLNIVAGAGWKAVIGPIGLIATAVAVLFPLFETLVDKIKDSSEETGSFTQKLENLLRLGEGLKPIEVKVDFIFKTGVDALDNVLDDFQKSIGLKKITKEIDLEFQAKVNKAIANLDLLSDRIDEASLTARDKIVKEYKAQLKITEEAIKLGGEAAKRGYEVRAKLNKNFQRQIGEIDKEENAKRQAELTKIYEDSSKSIFKAISTIFSTKNVDEFNESLAGGLNMVTTSLAKGAEGARTLIAETLTAGAEAILGPIGKAFGPIFDALSKGKEEVKRLVQEFVRAIPIVLANIIQSIPVLITTFITELVRAIPDIILAIIDSIPILIFELINAIPQIINAFVVGLIERLPEIVEAIILLLPNILFALIELLPQVISSLINQLPRIIVAIIALIPRIILSFIQQVPNIIFALIALLPMVALKFAEELIKNVPKIVDAIVSGIGKAIGNIGGGVLGGVFGAVKGIVKGIGGIFGFAEGGVAKIVPQGFLNDTFPASLTSGELVVSRDDTERLRSFLDRQDNGNFNNSDITQQIQDALDQREQNLTVNLVIGEDQLANAILNLNRRGFRLA